MYAPSQVGSADERTRSYARTAMEHLSDGGPLDLGPSDQELPLDLGACGGYTKPCASRAAPKPCTLSQGPRWGGQIVVEADAGTIRLTSHISSGQFGTVYAGVWRGVDVAVKRMKVGGHARSSEQAQELTATFQREVALVARLRHPNICLFMGAVAEYPKLFIISELCHRGSLHRILHQPKDVPWHRRLSFALDCARGCLFLHTHTPNPIVHLDLKSPNLFVDKHWQLKLGDFGLAQEKKHSVYVSQGCGGVGTPQWTAPEVLKGEPFNEYADVFSFGVVLWEIGTRATPFAGLTTIQVVVEVGLKGEPLGQKAMRIAIAFHSPPPAQDSTFRVNTGLACIPVFRSGTPHPRSDSAFFVLSRSVFFGDSVS